MKILYFLDFPFHIGGSNKVLLKQAFIMKQRGFEVKVIIPNDENGQHDLEYDNICSLYQLESETQCYHIYTCIEAIDILAAFRECEFVIPLIMAYKPNLIHSTQLNIGVELAARELQIPHLMNIYQVDCQSFKLDWMAIYPEYHSADSIVMSDRWQKGLKIPSRCIRVAYEPEEDKNTYYDRGNCNRRDREWINIVSIGVVYEPKNQLEIIKFIQMCRKNEQNVKLWILGDCCGKYAEKCKKYVSDNDLTNYVYFRGFVSNITEYLQNADLFVLASTVESYPGVIVESMANKVPIISTAVAGVPELLKDEVNGFLTAGYEAVDIYNAFLRYLKYCKFGKIFQIIENAYSTYLENHTYKAIGDMLEDYYQWIVEDYHNGTHDFLTIKQVKGIFNKFVLEKKIEQANQTMMGSIWFLYHIYPSLEKSKKVVIWGAGFGGSIALNWLTLLGLKTKVLGFIDIKKKGNYLEYPIWANREAIIKESNIILVAVFDTKAILEIVECLEKYGKQKNMDYFLICNNPVRI